MTINVSNKAAFERILEFCKHEVCNLSPSEWAEKYMRITVGARPGAFNFDYAPHFREVVDRFSPYDPCQKIVIMGGAQIAKTVSVIEPAILYYIALYPCTIGYLTGHADLSEESIKKLDMAIDNAGLRYLIGNQSNAKKKNSRTGDTVNAKEFPLGSLVGGSITNHKILRQRHWKLIIVDDADAGKEASKQSGDTIALIEQRGASYRNSGLKLAYISSPELDATSIIKKQYEKGDQNRRYLPCPLCGAMIVLEWEINKGGRDKAGIYYKADNGKVDEKSVGYVCQECSGFFTERHKFEMNLAGVWRPTAEPIDKLTTSYHMSTLYSYPGAMSWLDCAKQYVEAIGFKEKKPESYKAKIKAFNNLILGLPYEEEITSVDSHDLMRNARDYPIGIVPESLSIADGNGRIVMLTIAADINGKMIGYGNGNIEEDDVRLDYEVVAHSESGATYSIEHGSIGTFVKNENERLNVRSAVRIERQKWTADINKEFCVFHEFEKLLFKEYELDTGGKITVYKGGIDVAPFFSHAYSYLNNTKLNYMRNDKTKVINLYGLRGSKDDKHIRYDNNANMFELMKERNDTYMVVGNKMKDRLALYSQLYWNKKDSQPNNFMNFPYTDNELGLYTYEGYYKHYEAEKRVVNKDGLSLWVRTGDANHFYDCRIYNLFVKELIVKDYGNALIKLKEWDAKKPYTWEDLAGREAYSNGWRQ